MNIKNLDYKKNNISSFVFASTVIAVFLFAFYFLVSEPCFVDASSSIGTIDLVNKYAKGQEHPEVKINFGFFRGSNDIVITDSTLSGYAWGDNIGWVNLFPDGGGVLNNDEGLLSGYAASELGGWVNFNGVTIDSSGIFHGYATTEKLGKILFNCDTNNSCATSNFKVSTDWRPVSVRKGASPAPTYTTPAVTLPPVFTATTTTPDKETTTPKDTTTTTDEKPLPIGDTSLYESGGDVIKEHTTTSDGGHVTTVRLPSDSLTIPKTETSTGVKVIPQVDVKDLPKVEEPKVVIDTTYATNNITKNVQNTTKQIKKDAVIIVDTSAADISTKTVTAIGVAGGGTAIVTSLTSSLLSFSEFFLTFFRMWSLFLSALGLRKRRTPWGTVYDSVTKQPLDPAYVILLDRSGKEVATSITDLDGRYGFLAPPGIYHMVAKKTNYIAPSLHLHAKERDEVYDNLYFGEEIELGTSKTIARNIPMDPQGFDWNEFAKRDKNIMNFHPRQKLVAQISNALFYVGLLFSVGLFIIKPDAYNIAIIILYAFLFGLRFVKQKSKSFGTIKNRGNGFPLSFAIVRVYLKSTGKEMFHRVADQYGHYYCLLAKGEYYITIEKKNSDESYTKVYTSDVISVKNGIINQDFSI